MSEKRKHEKVWKPTKTTPLTKILVKHTLKQLINHYLRSVQSG